MPLWHFEKGGAAKHSGGADRVYVSLQKLVELGPQARGFAFLPRQPIRSVLAGRHGSRLRGRGLDFEELRGYLPGDDIRTIDWKVTARTGRPYVRVYTEERDRPAMLIIDQRQAMFFGSQLNMKSVTAAEVAALAAWKIIDSGDRVGAVTFNDSRLDQTRPQRSKATLLHILQDISKANTELRADSTLPEQPQMLNRALEAAAATARHDYLVFVVSDFDGADDGTEHVVSRMARHNDVVIVMVYDPMRTALPKVSNLVITDGELQVELSLGEKSLRRRLKAFADARGQRILDWHARYGLTVLPVSAGEDTVTQVRHLLGAGPSAPRPFAVEGGWDNPHLHL
jgi:uncharacterized protein (DUF58 family)